MSPFLLARVHAGAVAVLALLVMSATLLVAALPRAMEGASDAALSDALQRESAARTDLSAYLYGTDELMPDEPKEFAEWDVRLRSLLPAGLRPLVTSGGSSHYRVEITDGPVINGIGLPLSFVELAWIPAAKDRVRWVEGRAPGPPTKVRDLPLFEIALVRSAAQEMKLPVGSVVELGTTGTVAAKVTGLFELKDPKDRFWDHNLAVREINRILIPETGQLKRHITALVSDESLPRLAGRGRTLDYTWVFAIDPAAAQARHAPATLDGLREYEHLVALQEVDTWQTFSLKTDLKELITGFLGEQASASTVMYVVLGGLLVVALGLLVLAVQLLVERTDRALALARARGGSLLQVVGAGTVLVALAVLPAAAVGYAAASVVPGPVTPVVHAGPVVIVLAAVAGAVALLAHRHRAPLRERRDDLVSQRPSPRRVTVEVAIVALALGGAYLLRSRGLTTQGMDPFLVLVPFALAVAAALVTLRGYPFPLRMLGAFAARRRRAVPFLGLTLAARSRSLSALPVLVLLPALAFSVFAAVISTGLSAAQEQVAWQETGADARLHTTAEFSPETVERVRRVPGVERVVPAQISVVRLSSTMALHQLVAIDLAAFRALRPGSHPGVPAPPEDVAAPALPALVPAALLGPEVKVFWGGAVKLVPKGTVTPLPGFHAGDNNLIVVPFDARKRLGSRIVITTLFVKGEGLDAGKLAAAAGGGAGVGVALREEELHRLRDAPLTSTVQAVFRGAIGAFTLYALAAVILALVTSSAERTRALAFLRTLGLSAGQAQRLTLLEIAPMILLTAVAGLALGLGLPAALGPAIDLTAYTGNLGVTDYGADPAMPVLLAVAVTGTAIAGAYAHIIFGRPIAILRVGE